MALKRQQLPGCVLEGHELPGPVRLEEGGIVHNKRQEHGEGPEQQRREELGDNRILTDREKKPETRLGPCPTPGFWSEEQAVIPQAIPQQGASPCRWACDVRRLSGRQTSDEGAAGMLVLSLEVRLNIREGSVGYKQALRALAMANDSLGRKGLDQCSGAAQHLMDSVMSGQFCNGELPVLRIPHCLQAGNLHL